MSKSNVAILLPVLFASLLICALVLITCLYCYNPRLLFRIRHTDEESSYASTSTDEKPPSGVILQHEVVSITSSSDASSSATSIPVAIPVAVVSPDDDAHDATVITVAPDAPPVIEANPERTGISAMIGKIF